MPEIEAMPSKGLPNSSYIYKYKNCRLLKDHKIIKDDLWVRNGKILNAEKLFFEEKAYSDIDIDCNGAIICPGFIDLQINGAFGIDFSLDIENVEAGLQKVSKGLLTHGVTSFCPTIITSSPDRYAKVLPHVQKTEASPNGAGILGVHLEGPFISKDKKGAHPEHLIRGYENGFQDILDVYGTLSNVAIITLAPELKNTPSVIRELVKRGIKVSVGHSVASLSDGEEAVKAGASFITHLFNAMLPFLHRDPHLFGLLASDLIPQGHKLYFGMISDAVHIHDTTLRIAQRVHPDGLILVTDAIPALGLEIGIHTIGEQKVEIKDHKACIAGTNTLCGSIAPMNVCVQNFYKATGCTMVEALDAVTFRPAEFLGITHQKGVLNPGCDADFVMLDDKLNLLSTYIGGVKVW